MRIGFGYDVHRLVYGRRLILGGVEINYPYGLDGHSDADVLVHAVMDALLGAVGAGDIGRRFPDTDRRYKGISSLLLLREVAGLIADKGYRLGNIDSVVVCQTPRLAEHLPDMEKNIAKTLASPAEVVNVKATTTEGLGFAGKGKGIAAYAVAMVVESRSFC